MCRMLLMKGFSEDLLNALVEGAKDDPYGAKRWKNKEPNHPDGWGFVGVEAEKVTVRRSLKPIWEDEEGLEFVKKNFGYVNLIHVRKTSIKGTEKHPQNVQPVGLLNVLWVGYNGTMEPSGLEAPEPVKRMMNSGTLADTAAVAWAVLESYHEDPLVTAMRVKGWLEEALPEGSGAAVFFVDAYGNAGYAWECKACKKEELDYYKIYLYEAGGIKAVASSTVALKHGGKWEEAPKYGSL